MEKEEIARLRSTVETLEATIAQIKAMLPAAPVEEPINMNEVYVLKKIYGCRRDETFMTIIAVYPNRSSAIEAAKKFLMVGQRNLMFDHLCRGDEYEDKCSFCKTWRKRDCMLMEMYSQQMIASSFADMNIYSIARREVNVPITFCIQKLRVDDKKSALAELRDYRGN